MTMPHSRRAFLTGVSAGVLGITGPGPDRADASARSRQSPEKADSRLQKLLEDRIRSFRGEVGVYVRHLPTGRTASVHADELFPTASLIKVSIMLALFDRIERGELSYHQELTYDGTYTYQGKNDDILSRFKLGETIRLSKLIMLMITISDNSASKWCQELAGGGEQINRVLEANGFRSLRINARTPGREGDYEAYGWGQTSPREICGLLALIRENRAVNPAASEEMYRILTRIYWDGEALSRIPPQVQAASKQGALDRSRSEAVLVNAPHGDYTFSIITKNQEDQSWGNDNEGFVLLRDLSGLFWDHFEPRFGWKAARKTWNWDR